MAVPPREKAKFRNAAETQFEKDAIQLVGNAAYVKWKKIDTGHFDRQLKKNFKMTPEQIASFKDVENKRAIAVYNISHQKKLSPDEVKAKRQQAEQDKDATLKKVLTPDQYRKYELGLQRKESRHNYIKQTTK